MSTEHPNRALPDNGHPVHQDVAYEPTDVNVSPILKFLIALGIMVVLSYIVTIGIYKGLKSFWASSYSPPPPSRLEAPPELPPEPRLQAMPGHLIDPQQDLRNKIKADTEANNQLGWIDEKAGLAQIPVSDAMKIIAEKGLPVVATPPAETK
jgi:hypothetical protein